MNNKYKFKHELPKDQSPFAGKVSSPLCLAQLLTELLQINQTSGKVIYDCCVGVGALSSQIDTTKHILIGDDKELEYLKQTQQNNPQVVLFNHDALACLYGPPCYEHLVSEKWKAKVDQEIKTRASQLDEAEVQKEYDRLQSLNLTSEQVKEMTEKQEALLKQRALEYLIKQAAKQKKGENM